MRNATLHQLALTALAAASACLLSSCETTSVTRTAASRSLPAYEPPMAQSDLQTVRTTAYTHSEADHIRYGARNALGGQLRTSIAQHEAAPTLPAFLEANESAEDNISIAILTREKRVALAKQRAKNAKAAKNSKKNKRGKYARARKPQPRVGSAASDWSRYPVGTTFKVLSTGQVYKIDDYGWALAGRNTIDLYMGSRGDMNRWGVRHEKIKVLNWGDRQASLALLTARQHYKHCRRMVLQLQDKHEEAAALR